MNRDDNIKALFQLANDYGFYVDENEYMNRISLKKPGDSSFLEQDLSDHKIKASDYLMICENAIESYDRIMVKVLFKALDEINEYQILKKFYDQLDFFHDDYKNYGNQIDAIHEKLASLANRYSQSREFFLKIKPNKCKYYEALLLKQLSITKSANEAYEVGKIGAIFNYCKQPGCSLSDFDVDDKFNNIIGSVGVGIDVINWNDLVIRKIICLSKNHKQIKLGYDFVMFDNPIKSKEDPRKYWVLSSMGRTLNKLMKHALLLAPDAKSARRMINDFPVDESVKKSLVLDCLYSY